MKTLIPVPIADHGTLLGPDFNKNFANIMHEIFMLQNRIGIPLITKETWEYAVAKSIPNARHCGSGNGTVDVRTPLLDIDVKGLSVAKSTQTLSSEASMIQCLSKETNVYAEYYKNGDMLNVKRIFVDRWFAKTNNDSNLHLFVILRNNEDHSVNYCMFKVTDTPTLTETMIVDKMAEGHLIVPIIDEQWGRARISIGKRRLELQVSFTGLKNFLVHSHYSK
jgi:hypothetical protein